MLTNHMCEIVAAKSGTLIDFNSFKLITVLK